MSKTITKYRIFKDCPLCDSIHAEFYVHYMKVSEDNEGINYEKVNNFQCLTCNHNWVEVPK